MDPISFDGFVFTRMDIERDIAKMNLWGSLIVLFLVRYYLHTSQLSINVRPDFLVR